MSAALLLYGVARISADANLFAGETPNLVFNFMALQMYAALLVVTAIRLSRRAIWYDSALLVVLENGLVLVPFMLVSQAAFIEPLLGQLLVLLAGGAAVGRALWLRRSYPRFNLPNRALLLGMILLVLNMVAPLILRSIVDRTSVDDWAAPNQLIWAVLLPLAVLGANLLPRPSRYGGLNPERSWLPMFIYGLWVIGTGVHVVAARSSVLCRRMDSLQSQRRFPSGSLPTTATHSSVFYIPDSSTGAGASADPDLIDSSESFDLRFVGWAWSAGGATVGTRARAGQRGVDWGGAPHGLAFSPATADHSSAVDRVHPGRLRLPFLLAAAVSDRRFGFRYWHGNRRALPSVAFPQRFSGPATGAGLGSNTQPPMGGWKGRRLGSADPIRGEHRLGRARVSLHKGRALGGGRNDLHDRPVGARGVVGGWKAMSGRAAGVCSAGCSPDVRFRSRTLAGSA